MLTEQLGLLGILDSRKVDVPDRDLNLMKFFVSAPL
jgi:hypothetical protein